MPPTEATPRVSKQPAKFQCSLCPKRFTRAYNLRGHLRTHTDERPFVCTVCGRAFARQHDRKVHEGLHSGERKFVCKGDLQGGQSWGCGRRFALEKNLGRHFRSKKGRACVKPLLDEDMAMRRQAWEEMLQQNRQKTVSIEPAGSLPIIEQDRYQLPPGLYSSWPPANFFEANQGEQRSSSLSPMAHSSITEPPTKAEAFSAAKILRRYLQHPDRSIREKLRFREYLERTFYSDTIANDFLLEKIVN